MLSLLTRADLGANFDFFFILSSAFLFLKKIEVGYMHDACSKLQYFCYVSNKNREIVKVYLIEPQ